MRSNNLWYRIYSTSSISYFIHSKGNFECCFLYFCMLRWFSIKFTCNYFHEALP